jgi:hypothetical protein
MKHGGSACTFYGGSFMAKRFMPGFLLIAALVFGSCGKKEETVPIPEEAVPAPKEITVEGGTISGALGEYVEIVSKTCTLVPKKDAEGAAAYRLHIALEFKLLKTYDDTMNGDCSLFVTGIDKYRLPAAGEFEMTDAGRFSKFLLSRPGGAVTLGFVSVKKYPFEGESGIQATEEARKAFDEIADIAINSLSQPKHVLALGSVAGDVSAEEAAFLRASAMTGLLKNNRMYSLVDTGKIDQISAQHRWELSDWSSADKVAQIGKALNATALVTVHVTKKRFTDKEKHYINDEDGELHKKEPKKYSKYSDTYAVYYTEHPEVEWNFAVTVMDVNTMQILSSSEDTVTVRDEDRGMPSLNSAMASLKFSFN